jgi:hypothetical protein
MNMNPDNVILNLKIMTEVKKNDKLTFTDNILNIDRENIFQAFRRWYNGDSRTKSLEYINTIFESAFSLANTLIDELNIQSHEIYTSANISGNISGNSSPLPPSDRPLILTINKTMYEATHGRSYDLLQRLLIEMTCATKGIINLKETYTDDILTLSKIALLEDKIRIKIDKITSCFRTSTIGLDGNRR